MSATQDPSQVSFSGLFIRAFEVWLPNSSGDTLEFGGGSYGGFDAFREASRKCSFAYGEGLPGRAWKKRQPEVISRIDDSNFLRSQFAEKAGITAGFAIPILAGEYLFGVVVFLCGEDQRRGALELWHCDSARSWDLKLVEGCYGLLKQFEFVSRRTSFRQGFGLPGLAWDENAPIFMDNLGQSAKFVRSVAALEAGITSGLALPFYSEDPKKVFIMTFMSSVDAPVARRVEIWAPDQDRKRFSFHSGFDSEGGNLEQKYASSEIIRGEGVLGRVLQTGVPIFAEKGSAPNGEDESFMAFPMNGEGRCRYLAIFYI